MDFLIGILFVIEAVIGVGSIFCIVAVMFGTIFKKIYRKAKFGEPMM